jgi:hypothetical protein
VYVLFFALICVPKNVYILVVKLLLRRALKIIYRLYQKKLFMDYYRVLIFIDYQNFK